MTGTIADDPPSLFETLRTRQREVLRQAFGQLLPGAPSTIPEPADLQQWGQVGAKLQKLWLEFQAEQAAASGRRIGNALVSQWTDGPQAWEPPMPLADPAVKRKVEDWLALMRGVIGSFRLGQGTGSGGELELPRSDKRFADPKWREHPVFALIHQSYLMVAEEIVTLAGKLPARDEFQRQQRQFNAQVLVDALSPSNFALTNPVVLERTLATRGQNLVKGMEHLLRDLRKGQLTHTDPDAFELGRNLATTPGKVVYETELFQLIQYTPTTPEVLATPLVIFPSLINRFYILDLNPKKSFVRWAVEQGLTVFMVSWKSADASMRDVVWDDYVLAQVAAIDHARERLKAPSAHVIGYCVAGTTLAATLALLARRGEADKIKSATLFAAQVDFELSGDLKLQVDDRQIALMERIVTDGYLDGRYMAATFNMLRGPDLIWRYVIDNYLLGEDYPAFDMLHWNGDTTNLPWKWHKAYLLDLYRDNKLVHPDAISVDGTPIDLGRIETPLYIQAGREDHIAPPDSVWRITRHVKGPWRFVLAGSGHIAGVINPPDAAKYQYWTNPGERGSLEAFIAGADETKGSWWPDWVAWLKAHDPATVPAKGKRAPGGRGDKVLEDAPGAYVKLR